jgi:DNA (cytosine-5)-methyltransferase 1
MRLLDLFCGAGGAAMGYHRAGFTEITGIDNRPQKNYPFRFLQADALEYLAEHGHKFDAIHASPPCQRYSIAGQINKNTDRHPDLVGPTRELLRSMGCPWIIENVPRSPLLHPILICGLALGIRVKRHRLFECNFPARGTTCPKGHPGDWVTVFGGGAPAIADARRRAAARTARIAMGIEWMTRDEISQAIPPAYTEFVGRQLLQALKVAT